MVAVEDPMLLAATWIALEDVVEGSGELAFYDRSHRLPHYLFKDGTKRIHFKEDDQDLYVAELDGLCRRNGMAYECFLAKKGDVFFWTPDLVHRSHPRTLPDGTSRLSCVTHYHPATRHRSGFATIQTGLVSSISMTAARTSVPIIRSHRSSAE